MDREAEIFVILLLYIYWRLFQILYYQLYHEEYNTARDKESEIEIQERERECVRKKG